MYCCSASCQPGPTAALGADRGYVRARPSEAEYRAAVAEFDRLWDRSTSPQERHRMDQLLTLLERFEAFEAAKTLRA